MGYIVLTAVESLIPLTEGIFVFVDWKLCSLPDLPENWELGTSHYVDATGTFSPSVVIDDLDSEECYDVRVSNTFCGGLVAIKPFYTGNATTTSELPPFVALPALIGEYDSFLRYCDYEGFPDVFYRSEPFDDNIYADSSLTTLAPEGLFLNDIDLRVGNWNGVFYSNTTTSISGDTEISYLMFSSPNSGRGIQLSYVPVGETIRHTYKITNITGTPPAQWRVEGTNAESDTPIIFSSYASVEIDSEITLDIPHTVCDTVRLVPAANPLPIITDDPYNIDFNVSVEVI